MSGSGNTGHGLSNAEAAALIAFYVEAGVTDFLGEEPVDRYALADAAPQPAPRAETRDAPRGSRPDPRGAEAPAAPAPPGAGRDPPGAARPPDPRGGCGVAHGRP